MRAPLVALAALAACGGNSAGEQTTVAAATPEPAAPAVEEEAPAEPEPALPPASVPAEAADDGIADRWWDADAPCPDDASLQGAPPPDGDEVWCARDDDTRHGPYTGFHRRGDRLAARGNYRDGQKDGVWTWWNAAGVAWRQIEFADGRRHGRILLWDRDGTLTRAERWEEGNRVEATAYEDDQSAEGAARR